MGHYDDQREAYQESQQQRQWEANRRVFRRDREAQGIPTDIKGLTLNGDPAWPETAFARYKWDSRFIDLARVVAGWSKDPSTKCEAVVVRPLDRSVCSVGFNGFPRGCSDAEELYEEREVKLERVVHAEMNALLFAPESVRGYTLYTAPPGIGPSCQRCTAHIIQAGISDVVHMGISAEGFSSRWAASAQAGLDMYREAGVRVWSWLV